jgi:glycosyltransferase involved in cell wall biosynthesis
MNMDISIITVCFNSRKTIHDTIQSILAQGFASYEYIIIDGGSTDGTLDIISSYQDAFREKGVPYRWTSEPDRGIYDAMNKGIRLACGRLIGIINSDDWYEPHTLQTVFGAFSELADKDNTVIYGIIRLWRDGQEYAIRRFHHNFVKEQVIQHPTCFVPRTLYDRYGGFHDDYKLAGDFELLNRFNSQGVRFHNIDKVLTNFRLGGASASGSSRGTLETLRVMKDYGAITPRAYQLRAVKARITGVLRRIIRL